MWTWLKQKVGQFNDWMREEETYAQREARLYDENFQKALNHPLMQDEIKKRTIKK